MKRVILGLILSCLSVVNLAGQTTLSWTDPTTYTSGTPLATTGDQSLAATRIDYFPCSSPTQTWPSSPTTLTILQPTKSWTISGLTDGLLYCFRAASILKDGTPSVPSAVGSKLSLSPNPPSLVALSTVAYKQSLGIDTYSLVPFGTISAGTVVDPTHIIDGAYCLIPQSRTKVTLTNKFDTYPTNSFAKCL